MHPEGLESAIPASKRLKTFALDSAATEVGTEKSYYYRYSALEPVWAEARAQSGDWYSSGTLHPGQVLRGSLPLLSPGEELPG